MDEQSVRQQLLETKERLDRVDEEREILLSLVHGFEGWLRLNATADKQISRAPDAPKARRSVGTNFTPKGTTSIRAAARSILMDAHGAPLHVSEIFRRATEMGAVTSGERPDNVVDSTIANLSKKEPFQRVSARTWRWTGGEGAAIRNIVALKETGKA